MSKVSADLSLAVTTNHASTERNIVPPLHRSLSSPQVSLVGPPPPLQRARFFSHMASSPWYPGNREVKGPELQHVENVPPASVHDAIHMKRQQSAMMKGIADLLKGDRAQVHQHEPDDVEALEDDPVYKTRKHLMPYFAEFLGTLVFVMFGCGANCQVGLTQNPEIAETPAGNWTSLALGWGAGLAIGVWISGGGHVNPAVTIAMAAFRGFPWHRVPLYWLSQLLGGVCGAGIVYGNYKTAISIQEGGPHIRTLRTAGYFGTVPLQYVPNIECFFSEFTGAALLVMSIFAMSDLSKNKWRTGELPIGVFILFTGIAVAFGAQTSFAHNPARDLGPRMFTAMVGYGRQVFTFRNWYWLYAPVLGGLTGGLLGGLLYDVFLYGDKSNVINKLLLWSRGRRRARQPTGPTA